MHITDKVQLYLTHLGDTPNTIADALMAQGITGRRLSASECPLANALVAMVGDYKFVVAPLHILAIAHSQAYSEMIPTPLPAEEFIHRFDEGYYPELESRENPA